jgi:hypothetical protein
MPTSGNSATAEGSASATATHNKADLSNASASERAGLWSKISFSWVGPLIKSGWAKELDEEDARFLVPSYDDATALAEGFDAAFAATKVWHWIRQRVYMHAP